MSDVSSAAEPRGRRERVRAAGLDPDYWYAVEYDRAVRPGQVVEVKFWGESIALFRGDDGELRALENRCAHRQLKLSLGAVTGCTLTCAYHGWSYDGTGELRDDPPRAVRAPVPVGPAARLPGAGALRPRLGLPRRPGARRPSAPLPEIPELEGPDAWACVPVDFTWKAHHSMIIDNVSDFTHAYLHRRYRPFVDAKLTRLETVGDRVLAELRHAGRRRAGSPASSSTAGGCAPTRMELGYEYPYQWSNTDDRIKHWCFVLPIDERTTRVFFLFYFEPLKVPFLAVPDPARG